jgi:hypothetical protein
VEAADQSVPNGKKEAMADAMIWLAMYMNVHVCASLPDLHLE